MSVFRCNHHNLKWRNYRSQTLSIYRNNFNIHPCLCQISRFDTLTEQNLIIIARFKKIGANDIAT